MSNTSIDMVLHRAQSRYFHRQSFWLVLCFWLIPTLFSCFGWRNHALFEAKFRGWLRHLGYFQSSIGSYFFASNFFLSELAFCFGN